MNWSRQAELLLRRLQTENRYLRAALRNPELAAKLVQDETILETLGALAGQPNAHGMTQVLRWMDLETQVPLRGKSNATIFSNQTCVICEIVLFDPVYIEVQVGNRYHCFEGSAPGTYPVYEVIQPGVLVEAIVHNRSDHDQVVRLPALHGFVFE